MAEPVTDDPGDASRPAPAATPPIGSALFRRLIMAFTFARFRNMWLAAFTSAIGTWVQRIAQQWLILSLTGSAFFLGLDTFLAELPLLLFTLIGGVVADRHDRRHLLMGSQALQMACALTLTAIVFFDVVQVRYILARVVHVRPRPGRSADPPSSPWFRPSCPGSTCPTPSPSTRFSSTWRR